MRPRRVQQTTGYCCENAGRRNGPALSSHDGARRRAADLLAKSPEQNLCGKIYSHHGAKLDENRTSAAKMRAGGTAPHFLPMMVRARARRICWRSRRSRTFAGKSTRITAPNWTKIGLLLRKCGPEERPRTFFP